MPILINFIIPSPPDGSYSVRTRPLVDSTRAYLRHMLAQGCSSGGIRLYHLLDGRQLNLRFPHTAPHDLDVAAPQRVGRVEQPEFSGRTCGMFG